MTRRLGAISLCVAVGGMVTVEALIHAGSVVGPAWRVIATGFEAATIGGVADWFAVRALFRRIPIPIIGRHTDVIVKNRERIASGIVDMVENRWLTKEAIHEQLRELAPARALLAHFGDPRHQAQLIELSRDLFAGVVEDLGRDEIAEFLERVIKDQLRGIELAQPLGRWLQSALERRDHDRLWGALVGVLQAAMEGPRTERVVAEVARRSGERYASGNLLRSLGVGVGQASGALDYDEAARSILAEAKAFIGVARDDDQHPLRLRMDEVLARFATDLQNGDPAARETVEDLRRRIVENAELHDIVQDTLTRFRETARGEVARPDSALFGLLRTHAARYVEEIAESPERCERLDDWLRTRAEELVTRHHALIGDVVRSSLSPVKLPDHELVRQIEDKVGDDLEYIRLNGAVVGGLVGVLIAIVRLML